MKKNIKNKECSRGFTLMELVIVIGILGLLVSVVVVLTGPARDKGRTTAIKSQAREVANQINIDLSNGVDLGYYDGQCPDTVADAGSSIFANQSIVDGLNKMKKDGTGSAYCLSNSNVSGVYPNNIWVMLIDLPEASNQVWCIDYAGASGIRTGGATTSYDTALNLATYQCI